MSQELERAATRLARDPRVLAVYGFGSRCRDQAGPRRDVDVAVLLDRRLSLAQELRLRSKVVALGQVPARRGYHREAESAHLPAPRGVRTSNRPSLSPGSTPPSPASCRLRGSMSPS